MFGSVDNLLATKNWNCRGFYLQTLVEKQNPEAKSPNIMQCVGALSFCGTNITVSPKPTTTKCDQAKKVYSLGSGLYSVFHHKQFRVFCQFGGGMLTY